MSETTTTTTAPETGAELIARFRSQLDAVPATDVVDPRVDVVAAASTAIGAMPEIEMHRAALVELFGSQATSALDGLVPSARTLLAANAAHVIVVQRDLEPQAKELRTLRDVLASTADELVSRGLVDARSLSTLEGGSSYQSLFTDTQLLVAWFHTHRRAIGSRSSVTQEELARAYQAAEDFAFARSKRDQAREGTSQSALDRARAFTLFFRNYDAIRRMLAYLRFEEGDAEKIAPSIYSRDRAHHADDAAPLPPLAPTTPVAPGMPGGSPFQS